MNDGAPKRKAERAKVFDILVNEEDDVLIALDARDTDADNPTVLIQGGKIILIRSKEDALFLPDVPDSLVQKIAGRPDVLVAETNETGVVREYVAGVKVS